MPFANSCHARRALLLIFAAVSSAAAAESDPDYQPNPLFPRVTASLTRLERATGLDAALLRRLRQEGAECVAAEERYSLGRMPIQKETRTARQADRDLATTGRKLATRIKALNDGLVDEDPALEKDIAEFEKKKNAHKKYLTEDLNPRVEAEILKVSQRYLKFARHVEEALLLPGQKSALRPFKVVWDGYQRSRKIAKNLAEDENRCALVLSMTMDLRPGANEASLKDIGDPNLVLRTIKLIRDEYPVIREVKESELGGRFYIRAAELANRFRSDWGEPETVTDPKSLANRKGVVFFKEAYNGINHIDLWDDARAEDKKLASELPPKFESAKAVWFWPIIE